MGHDAGPKIVDMPIVTANMATVPGLAGGRAKPGSAASSRSGTGLDDRQRDEEPDPVMARNMAVAGILQQMRDLEQDHRYADLPGISLPDRVGMKIFANPVGSAVRTIFQASASGEDGRVAVPEISGRIGRAGHRGSPVRRPRLAPASAKFLAAALGEPGDADGEGLGHLARRRDLHAVVVALTIPRRGASSTTTPGVEDVEGLEVDDGVILPEPAVGEAALGTRRAKVIGPFQAGHSGHSRVARPAARGLAVARAGAAA